MDERRHAGILDEDYYTRRIFDDTACTSGLIMTSINWHHVRGHKNGTTKIELFVDGLLVASDPTIAASGTLDKRTLDICDATETEHPSGGWQDESVFKADDLRRPKHARPMNTVCAPIR